MRSCPVGMLGSSAPFPQRPGVPRPIGVPAPPPPPRPTPPSVRSEGERVGAAVSPRPSFPCRRGCSGHPGLTVRSPVGSGSSRTAPSILKMNGLCPAPGQKSSGRSGSTSGWGMVLSDVRSLGSQCGGHGSQSCDELRCCQGCVQDGYHPVYAVVPVEPVVSGFGDDEASEIRSGACGYET